ncbi:MULTISPECIES: ABC transporter ATP-binding protein [Vagococcus]|uniref:Duplicated ATPase component CbrU of energizing module of predicted cobalamin ECF transporter n=1 Tax=Vagococcus fluvialis bH819 TaxID=1255619 RepID=A0A1X6WLT5_9ENTE|nr:MULTISPECIES: ABC transporter ATP-binding protein [Vagococcus]SLM85303.1 Duplicated ATPase component CbrU of energizing module of predicted cobalamin ECF transporter [Vagococcus fluvialis bH819]HCM89402.1 ABC transporter ATP-binding protein [Vagococcus sp.]
MAYITCDNFSYSYPLSESPILSNLSFSANKGEFIAIVGENSSGKTTLCNALRGFVPHFYKGDFSGEITVAGKKINQIKRLSDVADLIGYIFQNPFTQMSGIEDTVFQELAFGLENLGLPKEKIIENVSKILRELDLESIQDCHPLYLSGGQQQKVALGSILAMDPEILIADEPTSQLDPVSTNDIFSLLKKINNNGKTIFLVEHKIDLIYEYASRILVMHDGKIIIDDKPETAFLDNRLEDLGVELPKILELGKLLQKRYNLAACPINKEEIKEVVLFYKDRK